jgi:hypothetical protein
VLTLPVEARRALVERVGSALVDRVELEHADICRAEGVSGSLASLLALIYFRLGRRPGATGDWEAVPCRSSSSIV